MNNENSNDTEKEMPEDVVESGNRSTYRKDSLSEKIMHSCMLRLLIALTIIIVLAFIAHITVPSEEKMERETIDNVRQCLKASHGVAADFADNIVNNVSATLSVADTTDTIIADLMTDFMMYNRLETHQHYLYSTTRVYNNYNPNGKRISVGVFGTVVSTMNFRDFVMRAGRMRKEYNQKIIKTDIIKGDDYMGDNPDLSNTFEYHGDR